MAKKYVPLWKESRFVPGHSVKIDNADVLYTLAIEYFEFIDETCMTTNNEKKTSKKSDLFGPKTDIETKKRYNERPYQIRGFCAFSGINFNYFNGLKARMMEKADRPNISPEEKERCLSIVACWEWVQDCIYNQKYEGGITGAFNPMLVARDLGLQERTQTDLTNSDGSLKPNITVRDEKTAEQLDELVNKLKNNNKSNQE